MMARRNRKPILCFIVGMAGVVLFFCAASAAGQTTPQNSFAAKSTSAASRLSDEQGQSKSAENAADTSSRNGKQKQVETSLPDYVYDGPDIEEQLLCQAHAQWTAADSRHGFSVTASKVLGSYRQGSKLKLFARINDGEYSLSGSKLSFLSGSSIPAAVTFTKDANGIYKMDQYEIPQDGTLYAPSIHRFCTQPVTGEEIGGLADKIIGSDCYSQELTQLEYQHLANHLHRNGIRDAVLQDPYGKVEFSLRNYYK